MSIKKLVIGVVGLLLLAGCADHYPKYAEEQRGIAQDNKALFAQVMAARATRDAMVLPAMASNGGTDKSSMMLYSIIQSDREAALANAFKTDGLEAPTTSMDVGKAFVGNFLPTLVKAGAGVIIAHDMFGALGGGGGEYNVGGDFTSTNMNVNTSTQGDVVNDILLDQSVTTGIPVEPMDIQSIIGMP